MAGVLPSPSALPTPSSAAQASREHGRLPTMDRSCTTGSLRSTSTASSKVLFGVGDLDVTRRTSASFFGGGCIHPACQSCGQVWSWPRNILHINNPVAHDVRPSTKHTLVAYLSTINKKPSLHPEIFRRLQLITAHDVSRRRLVREFEYHKESGYVHYESFCNEDDWGYARLITLNSWWCDLLVALIQVAAGVFDLATNAMMCAERVAAFADAENPEDKFASLVFIGGFALSVCLTLFYAVREARREILLKADPRIGDFTLHCSRFDRLWSLAALVFFMFFGVSSLVRDIPIVLHPWKGVQPYAAIKINGTRAFAVGYRDRHMYDVEIHAGQNSVLPPKMLAHLFTTTMKFWLLKRSIVREHEAPLTLVYPCVMALVTFAVVFRKYFLLWRKRREFIRRTEEKKRRSFATSGSASTSEMCSRPSWREEAFTRRHFLRKAQTQNVTNDSGDPLCHTCGRKQFNSEVHTARLEALPPEVGQVVVLSEGASQFSDAKRGPLKHGELGEVVRVAPPTEGYGTRVLVLPLHASLVADPLEVLATSWWYDAAALSARDADTTPLEVEVSDMFEMQDRCSDLGRKPGSQDTPRLLHSCACRVGSAGSSCSASSLGSLAGSARSWVSQGMPKESDATTHEQDRSRTSVEITRCASEIQALAARVASLLAGDLREQQRECVQRCALQLQGVWQTLGPLATAPDEGAAGLGGGSTPEPAAPASDPPQDDVCAEGNIALEIAAQADPAPRLPPPDPGASADVGTRGEREVSI